MGPGVEFHLTEALGVLKNGSSHEHIIGVITDTGSFNTKQQVVNSINAGNDWRTSVPGEPKASIKECASVLSALHVHPHPVPDDGTGSHDEEQP
jgi:hypothetical protein